MLRYRARSSGAGFLGEAGLWRNGDWYELHLTQNGQPVFANTEMCADVVGEHFDTVTGAELDHPFTLERIEGSGPPRFRCDSDEDSNGTSFRMRGWVPGDLKDFLEYSLANRTSYEVLDGDAVMNIEWPSWLEHMDLFDRLSPVTDLLSKTNPNVPETDIPSFLFESLRDAPSLIYEAGRSILGFAGSVNLSWQFGWKPLLADLRNLLAFGYKAQKKLQTIERLCRDKRLRVTRSVEGHDDTDTSPFEVALGSSDNIYFDEFPEARYVTVDISRHTVIERWGTVTYRIREDFWEVWETLPFDEKKWIAARSAFGLHAQNPAALWEIIPWSWLVDWFIPMQNLLSTYNNFIPVEAKNLCLMTRQTTDFSFGSVSPSPFGLEEPTTLRRVTKSREVMSDAEGLPQIKETGLQFLGERQLEILASIGILKYGL